MTVSVIIPTYNRATLLVEAVDSVLNQSYQDFEIIIVDDGSTDDTEQRIRNYSDKIVYIKQQNSGVNAARNRALSVAQGEYIALLDSDDLWFDFKLELQVKLLEQHHNVGFVFSDFLIRKETGGEIHGGLSTWHRYRDQWIDILPLRTRFSTSGKTGPSGLARFDFNVYQGDVYHASLFEPYVLPSTALIRRRCIDPDFRLVDYDPTCGDWDFFARLSHRHSALYMDIETAVNRSHEDEVRLTRLPQSTQTRRRLDMIDRIWAADSIFCDLYGHEVEMVKNELWMRLAKHQAMAGDITGARESLNRRTQAKRVHTTLKDVVIGIVISLPGAGSMLKFMIWMRIMLRSK